MWVTYLTVFLVFSTTGAIAPLIQAPFFLLFSLALVGFSLFFNTAFNSTKKITNTKKLAKVFVNEIYLPPPLFHCHTHICNGLHLYKLFFSPSNM